MVGAEALGQHDGVRHGHAVVVRRQQQAAGVGIDESAGQAHRGLVLQGAGAEVLARYGVALGKEAGAGEPAPAALEDDRVEPRAGATPERGIR